TPPRRGGEYLPHFSALPIHSQPQESAEEQVLPIALPGPPSAVHGDQQLSTTRRPTALDSGHPRAECARASTCVCPTAPPRRAPATFQDTGPRAVHLAAHEPWRPAFAVPWSRTAVCDRIPSAGLAIKAPVRSDTGRL